jgi:hypothetical protein
MPQPASRTLPTFLVAFVVMLVLSTHMPSGTERTRRYGKESVAGARPGRPPRSGSCPSSVPHRETGFLGGATALRVTSGPDADTRPSTEQLYAAYTAKQQFRAFLSTDRWTTGNRWGVNAQLEYQRFPQPFFGVGIGAPESAEEWYEARSVLANVTVAPPNCARDVWPGRLSLLGYEDSRRGRRRRDRERLDTRGRGRRGFTAPGRRAWDSRDNVFAPASGTFVQATAAYSGSAFGADYDFSRYIADARRYVRLGRGVLAGQAYLEATSARSAVRSAVARRRRHDHARVRTRPISRSRARSGAGRVPHAGRGPVWTRRVRGGGDGRADAVHAHIEHAPSDVRRWRAVAAPAEAAHGRSVSTTAWGRGRRGSTSRSTRRSDTLSVQNHVAACDTYGRVIPSGASAGTWLYIPSGGRKP